MNYLAHKRMNQSRRAGRVRTTIRRNSDRPRLSVFISNFHITAQIIDDNQGSTLVYVTTVGQKQTDNMSQKAAWVGTQIAAKAKKSKVTKVVLDRGSRKYHGRIKALAEAARKEGMEL